MKPRRIGRLRFTTILFFRLFLHLKTNEYAYNNDDKVEAYGCPVLVSYVLCDASQQRIFPSQRAADHYRGSEATLCQALRPILAEAM